jgi:hypothetical protein
MEPLKRVIAKNIPVMAVNSWANPSYGSRE